MICTDCGKLIGEGTMGTVLPLCQCQWRPKPQTFYIQDQSAEITELRKQLAACQQERDNYKAALEKIERLPYDEIPDHHQNIAHDALAKYPQKEPS